MGEVVGQGSSRELCSGLNPNPAYQTALVNMCARAYTHAYAHSHTHTEIFRGCCPLVIVSKILRVIVIPRNYSNSQAPLEEKRPTEDLGELGEHIRDFWKGWLCQAELGPLTSAYPRHV